MIEIKKGQELEVRNVLSFRGKIKQKELENIGKDMELKVNGMGGKRAGNPITVIHSVEKNILDFEILLPVDKILGNIGEYQFKERIKIVNAVVASYKGNPEGIEKAFNELNQYIMTNNLQPITAGYNVTLHMDTLDIDNTKIDIYVGINPNIL